MSDLSALPSQYAVCRMSADEAIPSWAAGSFVAITRTPSELSIVCAEDMVPAGVKCEGGWRVLRVAGPLDFALTGVLAAIAEPLAKAGISIFAISTFDTDYVLVKAAALAAVVEVLRSAGHTVSAA